MQKMYSFQSVIDFRHSNDTNFTDAHTWFMIREMFEVQARDM